MIPCSGGRLLDVLQRLCRTLRSQRRVCRSLSLTIRYSDQVEVTKRERVIPETCWEMDLSPPLYVLSSSECFRRRVRLRLMTVSLTGLTAYAEQGSLFDERPPDEQRRQERAQSLAVALDTTPCRVRGTGHPIWKEPLNGVCLRSLCTLILPILRCGACRPLKHSVRLYTSTRPGHTGPHRHERAVWRDSVSGCRTRRWAEAHPGR